MARYGMRFNTTVIGCILGLTLTGCTHLDQGTVLGFVGPDPAASVNAAAQAGTLLVYSAYTVNADFNSRDAHRPEYSDYEILNPDETLKQRVHNNSGTVLQRPRRIELPPGIYRIVARANGYGIVTVPVVIRPGEDTVLHLEGGAHWPDPSRFNESNAVQLPNGDTVGWKSAMPANGSPTSR